MMLGLIQRAVCEKVDRLSFSRTLAPQIRRLTGGPVGINEETVGVQAHGSDMGHRVSRGDGINRSLWRMF